MVKDNIIFVSGIDTGVGKSFATGYIAKEWNAKGIRTITQKFIQTGNEDISEDIEIHRKIAGTGFLPEDESRLTMPEIYSYPCSPHLAAEIDGRPIDFSKIEKAAEILAGQYDRVLQEGAGGLMVPLTRDLLTIDYVRDRQLPLILVTSGKLGSINHTLLSLEAIKSRGIRLHSLVFNMYPEEEDTTISDDTQAYLKNVLATGFPEADYVTVPVIRV